MRLAVTIIVALAWACGGGPPQPQGPSPRDQRFASHSWDEILPGGAEGVLVVDIAAVARSKLAASPAMAEGVLGAVGALSKAARRCKVDTSDVGRIVLAWYSDGRYAVLFLGSLSEARASECLTRMLRSRGAELKSSEVSGRRAFHSSDAGDRIWMSVPVDGAVIVASKRALLRDILAPDTTRISGSESWLTRRAGSIDQTRPMWTVLRRERGGRIGELLATLGLERGLKDVSEVFAVVDIGTGLDISLGLGFPDAARASEAHRFLQSIKELMKPPPRFEAMIRSIDISLAGTDVTLSLSLDEPLLEALFGAVTGPGQTPDGP